MHAFLYKLVYACKSPAYGEGTAVPVQWQKHRAAYTDMPNMRPFVEVNTRALDKSHIREYLYRPACACNSPA